LNTSQQVGGSLGLAALVTVAATVTRDRLAQTTGSVRAAAASHTGGNTVAALHALTIEATVHGYQMAFRVGALGAGIAFLIAIITVRSPGRQAVPSKETALVL